MEFNVYGIDAYPEEKNWFEDADDDKFSSSVSMFGFNFMMLMMIISYFI